MAIEDSVTEWICSLRGGDHDSVQLIWQRYQDKLLEAARTKLASVPKRVIDEEDVAQDVIVTLFRAATAGRLADIKNRDDLWWLLLRVTKQKSVDMIRRETAQRRGSGLVQYGRADTEDSAASSWFEQIISDEPTPDFLVSMQEQHLRLMQLLRDDKLRDVANFRIEGYTVQEISGKLSVSTRSIERKLQLIRSAWSKIAFDGDSHAV